MKDFLIRNSLTLVSILTLSLTLGGVAFAAAFAGVLWWIYVVLSPFVILAILVIFSVKALKEQGSDTQSLEEALNKVGTRWGVVLTLVNVALMVALGWIYIPTVSFLLVLSVLQYDYINK